eukprot:363760-Chlamydomonas_euryale.AAC.3
MDASQGAVDMACEVQFVYPAKSCAMPLPQLSKSDSVTSIKKRMTHTHTHKHTHAHAHTHTHSLLHSPCPQGIIPDTLKDWNNYKTKEDEKGTEGLVIPLLPFGKKEYDEGERFDLRSPYADMGWVDPEETDMWSGLKKIGTKVWAGYGRSVDCL